MKVIFNVFKDEDLDIYSNILGKSMLCNTKDEK